MKNRGLTELGKAISSLKDLEVLALVIWNNKFDDQGLTNFA